MTPHKFKIRQMQNRRVAPVNQIDTIKSLAIGPKRSAELQLVLLHSMIGSDPDGEPPAKYWLAIAVGFIMRRAIDDGLVMKVDRYQYALTPEGEAWASQ